MAASNFAPVSPLELKTYALENNISQTYGPLTVTCDGVFIIKGRKVTLNDAIMAVGRHWKSQG